jgi:acid phosphatase family membrane protein YuiD
MVMTLVERMVSSSLTIWTIENTGGGPASPNALALTGVAASKARRRAAAGTLIAVRFVFAPVTADGAANGVRHRTRCFRPRF